MNAVEYPARIWKEGGVFYVQFLDMENAFTYGDTLEEAQTMAVDVLSALLASYLEHGEPAPKSSTKAHGKNIYWISPDAKIQAAMLLRKARAGRPQSDVAQKMGTTWQAYQKIEQPTSNTTIGKLQKAARVLGKKLVIELK